MRSFNAFQSQCMFVAHRIPCLLLARQKRSKSFPPCLCLPLPHNLSEPIVIRGTGQWHRRVQNRLRKCLIQGHDKLRFIYFYAATIAAKCGATVLSSEVSLVCGYWFFDNNKAFRPVFFFCMRLSLPNISISLMCHTRHTHASQTRVIGVNEQTSKV